MRGSAWEPYLRGAQEPPPQRPLLARLSQGLRPWLRPSRWQSSFRAALRSSLVAADAVREALRRRRGGDSGSGGSFSGSGSSFSGGGPSDALHRFNYSGMADILPVDVAWRMAEEVRFLMFYGMQSNPRNMD